MLLLNNLEKIREKIKNQNNNISKTDLRNNNINSDYEILKNEINKKQAK